MFGEIGQRDQRAEYLVRRLQADQALPAARSGNAAHAQRVENDAPSYLDRLAHGAAMFARVCLPGVAAVPDGVAAVGQDGAQVGGEGGQQAVDLGDRAARRQEGVDPPDHQGEDGGPDRRR